MALSGTVDWPLWAVDITLHNGQFEPNLYQTVQVHWRNKRTIGSYSIQDQPFMENLDEHEDNKWQMKNTIFSFIIWQTTLPHEVNKWQDLRKSLQGMWNWENHEWPRYTINLCGRFDMIASVVGFILRIQTQGNSLQWGNHAKQTSESQLVWKNCAAICEEIT